MGQMTEGTKSLEVEPNVGVNIPGLGFLECGFKARFSLARSSGAVLVLHGPIVTVIDTPGRIMQLFEDRKLCSDRSICLSIILSSLKRRSNTWLQDSTPCPIWRSRRRWVAGWLGVDQQFRRVGGSRHTMSRVATFSTPLCSQWDKP